MREINFYKSNKVLVLSLVLIVVNGSLFAQKDTLYFLSNWKPTVKDSAVFFRPSVKKEGDLFRFQDYYISGQIQMSGLSQSADKEIWQGKVTWYKEDGSILQERNYVANRLEGDYITYLGKKKLVAKYVDGSFKSGKRNISFGDRQAYFEQKNDTLYEVIYEDDINGIREEHYGTKDRYRVFSKYYDDKGELIGERTLLPNGYYQGVEVFYYTSPMRIKTINYYPYSRLLISERYYDNGQVSEKVSKGPVWSKTYYSRDGKELAKITYSLDRDRIKPSEGTELFFAYDKGLRTDVLQSSKTYESGFITKDVLYHDNAQTKAITTFEKGVRVLQVSFDEKGKEIARMVYANYRPLDGTEIQKGRIATYKSGELIEETNFFYNTEIPRVKKTKTSETYYDKSGKELGVLFLEDDNGYPKPKDGKRYNLTYDSGKISSIEEFKNGIQVKRTNFRRRKLTENNIKIFKTVEEYGDNGYDKKKEIHFYSNGKKQSEITYKKYKKIFGKFYDENENLLGSYDYEKKDGVLYEFFNETDKIERIEELKENKTQRLKKYNYGKIGAFGEITPILEIDLDVNCCAAYYDKEGELISKFTFKNQEPWEGIVYEHADRTKHTIKEGKRNGLYQKIAYNSKAILEEGQYVANKREGVFEYYDYQNNLQKIENYTDDKLNGKSVFYNSKGKVTSELDYKDGLPMNGVKILNLYAKGEQNNETYKDGELVESVIYDAKGKRVTKYSSDTKSNTILYYKDSDKKRVQYTIENAILDGVVTRYDTSGKEQHQAVFEKGTLKSGTVFLTPKYENEQVTYIILSKDKNVIKVKYLNFDNEVIFKAEEKEIIGARAGFIEKLNPNLNYLGARDLY